MRDGEGLSADYHLADETMATPAPSKYQLLMVSIGVFLVQYIQSQALLAPFLAVSNVGTALGPDVIGVIFSAYPLATAIATPLPPRVLRVFGLRGMVCFGLGMTAAANLAFGLTGAAISSSWDGMWLRGLSVAMVSLRAMGGVGAALAEAGCLTAVSTAGWGDDTGKALSSIEVTTGIGAAIGAALGGWLYNLGAFLLPMLAATCLPLCMIPFVARWLPSEVAEDDGDNEAPASKDGSAAGVAARRLRMWLRRCVTCTSLFFSAVVFEGLNPLFEPHLERHPYHFDVPASGMLLATICVLYTLTALPVGSLVDRLNQGARAGATLRGLMLCGWLATVGAAALLAPGSGGAVGAPRDAALWSPSHPVALGALGGAVLLLGSGAAIIIIPSLPDLQRGLPEHDVQGRATMCALWNGVYSAGSAVGPLLSVVVYARCGWPTIVLAQAAIAIVCAALLVLASVCARTTSMTTPPGAV